MLFWLAEGIPPLEDFESNLTRELDFTLEAQNGEETARQLAHRSPHVYVPKVFKELSLALATLCGQELFAGHFSI